jgi:putative endonuclease
MNPTPLMEASMIVPERNQDIDPPEARQRRARAGQGGQDMRKRTGDEGEELARQFLEKKGFLTVECKWRYGRGEIDIIAKDKGVLVFVEVKTQMRDGFGDPEDWITRRKQNQIARVAMGYLVTFGIENTECRFDVVTVDHRGEKPVINHIEDAFWVDAGAPWRMF